MRRREFITLLGGAATWPLGARAQQADRMRRLGVLRSMDAGDPDNPDCICHGSSQTAR
jgi:putative ABC transport system substrate-binding protein